jgi:hypothetical protein
VQNGADEHGPDHGDIAIELVQIGRISPSTDRNRHFHQRRQTDTGVPFDLILAGTCEKLVVSNRFMRKGILIFVCLTQVCRLQAQREQDPIQAILQLFEQHPIVMFGEVHGCVQEHALLKKLVTSPEFAAV